MQIGGTHEAPPIFFAYFCPYKGRELETGQGNVRATAPKHRESLPPLAIVDWKWIASPVLTDLTTRFNL